MNHNLPSNIIIHIFELIGVETLESCRDFLKLFSLSKSINSFSMKNEIISNKREDALIKLQPACYWGMVDFFFKVKKNL